MPGSSQKRKLLVVLSLFAPLAAFSFIVFRETIIPLLLNHIGIYASPDRAISHKTVTFFTETVGRNAILIVLCSLAVPLYIFVLTIMAAQLPESIPSMRQKKNPVSTLEWALLIIILLIASFYRIRPATEGFNDDEIFSAVHFIKTPSIIQTLTSFRAFHNHIAYSILARICYKLLGDAEWVYRIPSILFGLATVYLLWRFARTYANGIVATLSAAYLAILPFHIAYSSKARGYVAMTFCSLLSSYFFLQVIGEKNFKKSFLFVIATVSAIYFHLCGFFPFFVEMIFLVSIAGWQIVSGNQMFSIDRGRFVNLWICFAAVLLTVTVLYSPVVLNVVHNVESHGRSPFGPDFPVFVLKKFFGSISAGLINLALLTAGFVALFRRQKLFTTYLLMMTFVPFLALWFSRPADLVARFLFFLLPYLCLLISAGLYQLFINSKQRAVMLRPVLVAFGIFVFAYQAFLSWQDNPQLGFREAASAMNRDITPQTILCATGDGAEFYQYYSKRPIIILKSYQDFEAILTKYSEIRCAYIFTSFISTDPNLLKFLVENSRIRRFSATTVFIYRKT